MMRVTGHAAIRFVERFGATDDVEKSILSLLSKSMRLSRGELLDYGLHPRRWKTTQFWGAPYRNSTAVFVVRDGCVVSVLKPE